MSTARRPLVVLKLGGSLITEKARIMTLRRKILKRLCREVSRALSVVDVVLVHGAGSFGHPQVKMYELDRGIRNRHQLEGLTVTKIAVETLSIEVLKELRKAGVVAMPIHLSSCVLSSSRSEKVELPLDIIRKCLEMGVVPVLHGDIVIDEERGIRIVSGDYIAVELSISLGARRLVFALDVDGIYTSDPKLNPFARMLTELRRDDLDRISLGMGVEMDVTRGMKGKILEAFRAAEHGVEVIMVSGLRKDYVYKALIGELPERCTRLVA